MQTSNGLQGFFRAARAGAIQNPNVGWLEQDQVTGHFVGDDVFEVCQMNILPDADHLFRGC